MRHNYYTRRDIAILREAYQVTPVVDQFSTTDDDEFIQSWLVDIVGRRMETRQLIERLLETPTL